MYRHLNFTRSQNLSNCGLTSVHHQHAEEIPAGFRAGEELSKNQIPP